MKKNQLKKLALMGMTSGFVALSQSAQGNEDPSAQEGNSFCLENLMAKTKCAPHGCPSIVAEGAHSSSAVREPSANHSYPTANLEDDLDKDAIKVEEKADDLKKDDLKMDNEDLKIDHEELNGQ